MPKDAAYWRARGLTRRQDEAYRAQQRAWNKAWREANPLTSEQKAKRAKQEQERRESGRLAERVAARLATRNAIRRGDLVRQPCEVCGASRVDAHHDDYAKPLVVRWLCRRHHVEHHAKATGAQ